MMAMRAIGHVYEAYKPPLEGSMLYYRCKVCGLVEGEITAECPKEKVSSENVEAIREGRLNYIGGTWQRTFV
jgi:uncharacterized OB-fold protein